MFYIEDNALVREYDREKLWIEPWGKNSFRVRFSPTGNFPDRNNALKSRKESTEGKITIRREDAEITNGNITARISRRNRIIFTNQYDDIILEEYIRERAVYNDMGNEDTDVEAMRGFSCTLKLKSREFLRHMGGDKYKVTQRFESDPSEKIFGMGQYQHHFLDLKNCSLELAHRNSQVSIPFYLSSKGYGFLWNNPGIGKVNFSKNITEWMMESTDYIDYWITAGDTPRDIVQTYAKAVGTAPKMPDKLLGLWQSKMRYNSQSEVMEVAKKYIEKGIKPSVLVIDFFHWTEQGHFDFDSELWPDPAKMVEELNKMGIEVLISVWPTVSQNADNYHYFLEKGFLIDVNRGMRITMHQRSNTVFFDPTNPEARDYVWSLLEKNYLEQGIKMFWLDVAEPGYAVYDFDNYHYYLGPNLEVANIFPTEFSKMVSQGLSNKGISPVTLIRGAWAGSQKHGTLLWSGDIDSSFGAFRNQVNTGLNVSLAGNPWWTTDIGGFHGGDINDPEFRELMIRWFQYAVFSPILRMHGDRQPHPNDGTSSGASNEIWSYGRNVESILTFYIKVRELLKDYISNQFNLCHLKGEPLMRPIFYDYPDDSTAWTIDNTYMFGPDILVAPIMHYKQRERKVYLPPNNKWYELWTGKEFKGGGFIDYKAGIETIPIFVSEKFDKNILGKMIKLYEKENNNARKTNEIF